MTFQLAIKTYRKWSLVHFLHFPGSTGKFCLSEGNLVLPTVSSEFLKHIIVNVNCHVVGRKFSLYYHGLSWINMDLSWTKPHLLFHLNERFVCSVILHILRALGVIVLTFPYNLDGISSANLLTFVWFSQADCFTELWVDEPVFRCCLWGMFFS